MASHTDFYLGRGAHADWLGSAPLRASPPAAPARC